MDNKCQHCKITSDPSLIVSVVKYDREVVNGRRKGVHKFDSVISLLMQL